MTSTYSTGPTGGWIQRQKDRWGRPRFRIVCLLVALIMAVGVAVDLWAAFGRSPAIPPAPASHAPTPIAQRLAVREELGELAVRECNATSYALAPGSFVSGPQVGYRFTLTYADGSTSQAEVDAPDTVTTVTQVVDLYNAHSGKLFFGCGT